MSESNKDQVFLSYASENLEKAREVYEGLKRRSLKVWFDKESLGPGRWKQKVLKAIPRSRFFVILISDAALKKTGDEPGFQDEELQYAYNIAQDQPDKEFVIVPVRIEECDRGDHRLKSFQQYDLLEDIEKGLDKIAIDLGGTSLSDAIAKDERTEDEKTIDRLMGKAEVVYYAGEHDKAIGIWGTVIAFKPDDHDAWYNKGVALGKLGRYEDALAALEKAIEIKPDFHEAWSNKGTALEGLGRYEDALAAYEKAIGIKPDLHEAWYNKGNALGRLGRNEDALAAYEKAIEIKPDYHEAWSNKGTALNRLGRYEDAIAAYEKAIEIKQDYHEAWYNKGTTLGNLGCYEDALAAFEKAIEIKPDDFDAWLNKGVALGILDCYKDALAALEKAINIKPDLKQALDLKKGLLSKMSKK